MVSCPEIQVSIAEHKEKGKVRHFLPAFLTLAPRRRFDSRKTGFVGWLSVVQCDKFGNQFGEHT